MFFLVNLNFQCGGSLVFFGVGNMFGGIDWCGGEFGVVFIVCVIFNW